MENVNVGSPVRSMREVGTIEAKTPIEVSMRDLGISIETLSRSLYELKMRLHSVIQDTPEGVEKSPEEPKATKLSQKISVENARVEKAVEIVKGILENLEL